MDTDSLTLKDEDRAKLDGIVQKMSANNEKDEDIQFVVNDFKTKYGQKKNSTSAEDTTTPSSSFSEAVGQNSPNSDASSTSKSKPPSHFENENLYNNAKKTLAENPLFSDTNPNAEKNKKVFKDYLTNRGFDATDLDKISDDVKKGKELLTKNFHNQPQNPKEAIQQKYELGQGYQKVGDYDNALANYNEVLNNSDHNKVDEPSIVKQNGTVDRLENATISNALTGKGDILLAKKDYHGALENYQQVLQRNNYQEKPFFNFNIKQEPQEFSWQSKGTDDAVSNALKGIAKAKYAIGQEDYQKFHNQGNQLAQNNTVQDVQSGQHNQEILNKVVGEQLRLKLNQRSQTIPFFENLKNMGYSDSQIESAKQANLGMKDFNGQRPLVQTQADKNNEDAKGNSENESYLGGALKSFNEGFNHDVLKVIDGAIQMLPRTLGGQQGATAISKYGDKLVEDTQKNNPFGGSKTPEGFVGDVTSGVAGMIPMLTTLAVAPETKGITKFGSQMGITNFFNTFSETHDLEKSAQEGVKGTIEGNVMDMLGHGAGGVGELAKELGASKSLSSSVKVAAMATGFGGYSAAKSALETGKVNWDEAKKSASLSMMGLPELVKDFAHDTRVTRKAIAEKAVDNAVTNFFIAPDKSVDWSLGMETPINDLRQQAIDYGIKAQDKTITEAQRAKYTIAQYVSNAIADIKAVVPTVAQNPELYNKVIDASEMDDAQKAFYKEKVRRFAQSYNDKLENQRQLIKNNMPNAPSEEKPVKEDSPEVTALKAKQEALINAKNVPALMQPIIKQQLIDVSKEIEKQKETENNNKIEGGLAKSQEMQDAADAKELEQFKKDNPELESIVPVITAPEVKVEEPKVEVTETPIEEVKKPAKSDDYIRTSFQDYANDKGEIPYSKVVEKTEHPTSNFKGDDVNYLVKRLEDNGFKVTDVPKVEGVGVGGDGTPFGNEIYRLQERTNKREYSVDGTIVKLNKDGSFNDAGKYIDGKWVSHSNYGEQAIKNVKENEYLKAKKLYDTETKHLNLLTSPLAKKINTLVGKVGGLKKLKEVLGKYSYEEVGNTANIEFNLDGWLKKEGDSGRIGTIEKIIDNELSEQSLKETPKAGSGVEPTEKVSDERIDGADGNAGTVKFAHNISHPFTYRLVEAEDLQPSHLPSGERNPEHRIALAQPKERTDQASLLAQDAIANNPSFNEVGEDKDVYGGAPIVNERGEVIQGNNRSIGLKKHYDQNKTQYKGDLANNAEKFGFTKEQVDGMKNPVLVREVRADDQQAISLGQYDVKDMETGGKQRIDPVTTSRKMSAEDKKALSDILFTGDHKTLKDAIRANKDKVVAIFKKNINPSQIADLLTKEGDLTANGMDAIHETVRNFLFDNGDARLPSMFDGLPYTVQKGIEKAIPHILSVEGNKSILHEVQGAIIALHNFYNSAEGREGKFDQWMNDVDIFENKNPKELFTPLELRLAKDFTKAKNQVDISNIFAKFAENINGKKAENDLFLKGEDIEPLSKKEAIKQQFNIDYNERQNIKLPSNEGDLGQVQKKNGTAKPADAKDNATPKPKSAGQPEGKGSDVVGNKGKEGETERIKPNENVETTSDYRTADVGNHEGQQEFENVPKDGSKIDKSKDNQTELKKQQTKNILNGNVKLDADAKGEGGKGETGKQAFGRIISRFIKDKETQPDGTVVVAHSSVLKAIKTYEELKDSPNFKGADWSKLTDAQYKEFAEKYIKQSTENGDIETFDSKNGKIHVVRHGQTEDNLTGKFRDDNTQLTDKGRKQAKEAGQQLSKDTPKIISSDFDRAVETSNIISDEIGKEKKPLSKKEKIKKDIDDLLHELEQRKLENKLGNKPAEQGFINTPYADLAFKLFKKHLELAGEVTKENIQKAIDFIKDKFGGLTKEEEKLLTDSVAKDSKEFAMSHEKIDAERAGMGLPPIVKEILSSNEEIGKQALEDIDKSPELPHIIADEIIANGEDAKLSLKDQATMALARVKVHHDIQGLEDKLYEARDKSDNKAEVDALNTQIDLMKLSRDKFDKAMNIVGSIWGKFGNFRQMVADEEYSFKNIEKQFESEVGRPLTKSEKAELQTTIDTLKDTLKNKEKEINKLKNERLSKATDKAISEGEAEHKATKKETYSEQAKKIANQFRKGKVKNDILLSGIPFAKEAFNGAIEAGAKIIEAGGKVADAVDEALKYLRETDAYKKLTDKDKVDKVEKLVADNFKEEKVKTKEDFINDAKKAYEGGATSKPFRDAVKEIAKTYFGKGHTADEIVSHIEKDLGGDVTKEQIQKAISGHGIPTMTKKGIETEMNNLKTASALALRIEELKKGEDKVSTKLEKDHTDEIKALKEQYSGEKLQKKIDVANEGYKKAEKRIVKAKSDRINALQDELDRIRKNNRMSMEARNDRFISNSQKRIDKLQKRLDEKDFTTAPKPPEIAYNDKSKALLVEESKLKRKVDNMIKDAKEEQKSKLQKLGDKVSGIYRTSMLMGVGIYGKLAQWDLYTAIEKGVLEPIRKFGFEKAFPKLYDKSVVMKSGDLWNDYYKHFVDKDTRKSIGQTLRGQVSDFEHEFGDQLEKQYGKNWIGQTHLATKLPLLISETKRAYKKLTDAAADNGMDANNEYDQRVMKAYALAQGHDAILLGDNRLSTWVLRMKNLANQKDATNVDKVISFATKFLAPIDRIPNNFILRGLQYNPVSMVRGVAKAVKSEYGKPSPDIVAEGIGEMVNKINMLSSEEATHTVKLMERGLVGTAAYALATYLAFHDDKRKHIGGFQYEGRKQGTGGAKVNETFGIPSKIGHNPAFNALNIMATALYSYQDYVKAKAKEGDVSADEKAKSAIRGMINAGLGLASESPVGSLATELPDALKQGKGKYAYDLINRVVPNVLRESADLLDYIKDNTSKYNHDTYLDNLTYRIPFIREKFTTTSVDKEIQKVENEKAKNLTLIKNIYQNLTDAQQEAFDKKMKDIAGQQQALKEKKLIKLTIAKNKLEESKIMVEPIKKLLDEIKSIDKK